MIPLLDGKWSSASKKAKIVDLLVPVHARIKKVLK